MIIKKGLYVTNNSDLLINVLNVAYQNEIYAKIKVQLFNKRNGIVYNLPEYYKVFKKNIQHWEALEKIRG